MRRILLAALVGMLLLAPSTAAADPSDIIRDCADDSALQGDYSVSELRKARDTLPTDIDEYSDCRDVLSRAIAKATASQRGGGGGGDTSGGGGGTTGSGSSSGGSGTPQEPAPTSTPRPPIPPGPQTDTDIAALADALYSGLQPVQVGAKAVSPGESRLAASVGRNTVPSSLFAVFGLLTLAAFVALGAPFIRRRVNARTQT